MELEKLHALGQSVWLDFIRRDLLASGELARLVHEEGIRGMTTNPTMFEHAIVDTPDYDAALRRAADEGEPVTALYERLAVEDVQGAADVLRAVYEASDRRDGFVSIEVSPRLAHDTEATIGEARRLWRAVGRDNVMVKVPGTPEGVPAVRRLTADGINVNITLLFGRDACRAVREAYLAGLEDRIAAGLPIDHLASVASMFVSRIDVLVGKKLAPRLTAATGDERELLRGLAGTVGIANAKLAYEDWKQDLASPRWRALAARGARPQRLLWASTGTKDPALSDVLYVEALAGPDTIDTIPPKTLEAFRDHGVAADRLEEGLDEARGVMDALARAGLSMDALARELVDQGVASFSAALDGLLAAIERKRDRVRAAR